jgi:hypothetical protein
MLEALDKNAERKPKSRGTRKARAWRRSDADP